VSIDFEYWQLLLIPLFFGLGWLAARIDIKHLVRESRALPQSYFAGLNFLLNEQPDKAIEAFVEVVKIDPETVELHFALGNLFRRRGELDRAIRLHQNLLDRSDLPESVRLQALAAVGEDYLKAGLLDRAEEAFVKLQNSGRGAEAKQHLLEIYQQEKEWAKAIAVAKEVPGLAPQRDIAHYHCELAATALMNGRTDDARRALDAAFECHRQSVRASVLAGDLHLREGRVAEAIEAWQRVEQQAPAYLPLVAPKLMDSYRKCGREGDGLQLLRAYFDNYPSLDLLEAVYQLVLEADGPEAAYKLVRDELRRTPSLLGLDKLLEAQLLLAPPERRADLELVKNLVHAQTRRLARYRCDCCGFKARQFYWRCPACGTWESFPPRRVEEFEQHS
jgi:lipopolysaccharide biosynthesis regulator YciM